MNTIQDKPEASDLTKAMLVIGMLGVCAIAGVSFWWVMTAISANHLGLIAAIAASAIYCVVLLVIVQVHQRAWIRALGRRQTPSCARRGRQVMIGAAAYAALLLVAIFVKIVHPLHGVLAYALALLPAIPVVGMAAAMALYIRNEADEFERAVAIENGLWATGATLSIAAVWGFAETLADAPHAPSWLWFPLWCLFTGIADIFTRRRYR